MEAIAAEANYKIGQAKSAMAQGNVDQQTITEKVNLLKAQMAAQAVGVELIGAQIKKIGADIVKMTNVMIS